MIYKIMDVNAGGEIVARIETNNGKNALKRFLQEHCLTAGLYEIQKGRYNWSMFNNYGATFYAAPERPGGGKA